jgi:hypothetical protein
MDDAQNRAANAAQDNRSYATAWGDSAARREDVAGWPVSFGDGRRSCAEDADRMAKGKVSEAEKGVIATLLRALAVAVG